MSLFKCTIASALLICTVATGCSQTQTGAAETLVTGSAGPEGAKQKAAELPQCERPLGTVALVEKQIPALAQMGLTSPVPMIRLMIAQSNCFQVVDRGQALVRIEQEQHISGRGRGLKLKAAQYFLTPDIISQNANAGAVGGGVGALLPGVVGIVASSITQKSSEAQTALFLTDATTGSQVAAAVGSAKTEDYSFALGGAGFASGLAGVGGGYANTEIGKTTAAAFLDSYKKLVKQLQSSAQFAKR